MAPHELARFLRGGLAAVISGADAQGAPVCARCFGPRVDEALRTLSASVPSGTCDALLAALRPGATVAFGFTRVSDFESYQIKGRVRAVRPSTDPDRAAAALHGATFRAALEAVGYPVPDRLRIVADVTVEIDVEEIFRQTPGPSAGERWQGLSLGSGA